MESPNGRIRSSVPGLIGKCGGIVVLRFKTCLVWSVSLRAEEVDAETVAISSRKRKTVECIFMD